MTRFSQILLLTPVVLAGLVSTSNGQERASSVWKPGVYKSLRTGVSTMHDAVRKLGKPKLKTVPEGPNDPKLWQWHYEQRADVTCCDLLFRNGVPEEITLNLGNVEQSKAVQMFGGRFIKARFSDDYTREEGGSAPLCEDANGDQLLLLDPTRGLSLWVESDGKVSAATFAVARPGISTCRKRINAHVR
ncbi:MAG: hypothetical protein M3O09_02960 [Acidobacteriota bacterium]|nr:hypothetical protein [Acidobacteriota bacterium]